MTEGFGYKDQSSKNAVTQVIAGKENTPSWVRTSSLRFRRSEFASSFFRSKSPTNHGLLSPRHASLGRSTISIFSDVFQGLQQVL